MREYSPSGTHPLSGDRYSGKPAVIYEPLFFHGDHSLQTRDSPLIGSLAIKSISSSLLSKSLNTYGQRLKFSTDGVDVLIVQFSPAGIEPFYFCPSSIGCGIPEIP